MTGHRHNIGANPASAGMDEAAGAALELWLPKHGTRTSGLVSGRESRGGAAQPQMPLKQVDHRCRRAYILSTSRRRLAMAAGKLGNTSYSYS